MIEPFLRACPGPPVAVRALHVVAHQRVKGIAAGESEDHAHSRQGKSHGGRSTAPLRTLNDVAKHVFCTPDHLSKEARRYGFSIVQAMRWITFMQGCVLREHGVSRARTAERLGFSEPASWSRFVKNLTGKTPTQLPRLPLNEWVHEARRRVFLEPYR